MSAKGVRAPGRRSQPFISGESRKPVPVELATPAESRQAVGGGAGG